jgi:hypothetical protein
LRLAVVVLRGIHRAPEPGSLRTDSLNRARSAGGTGRERSNGSLFERRSLAKAKSESRTTVGSAVIIMRATGRSSRIEGSLPSGKGVVSRR